MRFLNTILTFTTTVLAIDIRGHTESHCRGNSVAFTNVEPDRCYATGGVSFAFSFVAIPKNWRLSTRSHTGDRCGPIVHVFDSNGKDSVCHGSDNGHQLYTGAGYSFINKKRSTISSDNQDCGKPDLLTMEDGPTYALAGLDDEIVKVMLEYASNGTTAAEMPTAFDRYISL